MKIKKLGKTIVFSIHDINTASLFATDYLLLDKGRLIQAPREQIFTPQVLSSAFDSKAENFMHPLKEVPQVLF